MRYEELTAAHLREWGREADALSDADLEHENSRRLGYAVRGDAGKLIAIGGVKWLEGTEADYPEDVHLVGWFEARGRSIWVHRMTVHLFSALAAAGERAVWAKPDPTIPNAELWLRRLGFKPREDGVWQRDLASAGWIDGAASGRRVDARQSRTECRQR